MKTLLIIIAAFVPSIASAQDCARVAATLKLPDATVTSARVVPAADSLPAYCRIELTIKPSSDSDIKSEVWMPVSGWNGKFQQVGNGAFAGSIQYGALKEALKRGYAAASTDTGHTGTGAQWAAGHPEKITDWGHRSVHLTAVNSNIGRRQGGCYLYGRIHCRSRRRRFRWRSGGSFRWWRNLRRARIQR